jgi:polysaccharide deacetylase family protein (PEP-CTERM system associated)
MLNVLTVDVEDYFHVEAFAEKISYDQWGAYECRVEHNLERILELFEKYATKATFFMLGWVAEKLPHLSRKIAMAGHEIGCHGYAHQRLQRLTPIQFRADLRKAAALLVDQVQQPILCYRAPSFSIVQNTMWALDILAEEGFRLDSSIFPVRHDFYGVPDAERFPNWQATPNGQFLFEFPPSTIRKANSNLGVAGGGYLRLAPYWLTRRAIRHINDVERQPVMVYFHPWEIDADQPVIRASLRSTLRHYTNLRSMAGKIEQLLQDFQFTALSNACARHPAYRTTPERVSDPMKEYVAPGIAKAAQAGRQR